MRQIERLAAGILATLLFAGLTTLNMCAQSTAQITGVVKDHGGAVIAGAMVTATQTDTDAKRTVSTDKTGSFILGELPIGPYRLEASASGFRTYVQTGIVLQVNSNPVINPVLEVGQVTETVQVQADAAMVETQNPGVGSVINNQTVLDMPLNGRDAQQLVLLAGMSSLSTGLVAGLNSTRNAPTEVITTAGGTGDGISYSLDGVNHNEPYDNQALELPNPDALQEFKVETSALGAQYGFHSNAAVNAVTKSGTNSYHGDVFEFVRNGMFDAIPYFATSADSLRRNQFGGVVGGPIKRNKLFFFAAYQADTERSNPAETIAYIPTPAMLQGNFSTVLGPACNNGATITLASKLPNGQTGFVNDQISPTEFDPTALNLTKLFPTASASQCGEVIFGLRNDANQGDWTGRLDYQLSANNSMFARTEIYRRSQLSSYDGKDALTSLDAAAEGVQYSVALGDTYLIGSKKINSIRASASREAWAKVPDNLATWASLGANITHFPQSGNELGNIGVGNGTTTGFNIGFAPNTQASGPDTNLADDFSLIKGPHQIQLGVDYIHSLTNFDGTKSCGGQPSFNGSWSESNSKNVLPLADFLLGAASSFTDGDCNGFFMRENYIALYVQDVFKINQHLTLSYGVRWEPFIAPYAANNAWDYVSPTLFAEGVHSTVYKNAPAGVVFPGDAQYTDGNAPQSNSWAKFAPRVGITWDPFGNGRMSIRAAYGIFNDRRNFYSLSGGTYGPPFGDAISLSAVNLTNPWTNYTGGNPFPLPTGPNALFPTLGTYDNENLNYHAPYMNQWNLNVQKQFGADWMVTANYVGNNTIHFPTVESINPGVYSGPTSTTSNLNTRRVFYLENAAQGAYYGPVYQADDDGTAVYDGLLLTLQKRVSHGVNLLSNYTWSHSICDVWDGATSTLNGGAPPPGLNYLWRGNCQNGDIRQIFNLSAVLRMPNFSNGVLGLIGRNWQESPIISASSAQFFSATLGTDVAETGVPDQPPIEISNPYPAQKTISNWVNIGAFEVPAAGTYGTERPFNLKGPDSFTYDNALERTFKLPFPYPTESAALMLRFEAFNIFNHPVFSTPAASVSSASSFGRITASGNPRILEFATKIIF